MVYVGRGTKKRRKFLVEDRGKKVERRGVKIGFWNVAGLNKKGADFYREIEEWDIICLVEAWVEEKNWVKT